jgi:hypothetical protein
MTPEKIVAALLVRRAAQLLAVGAGGLIAAIALLGVARGVGLALLAGGAAMAMSARSRL